MACCAYQKIASLLGPLGVQLGAGVCKCCGSTTKLIKAHLAPQAIARIISESSDPDLAIVDANSGRQQRKQTLEFDRHILCAVCDAALGKHDREVTRLVRDWLKDPQRELPATINKAPRVKLENTHRQAVGGLAAILLRHSYSGRFPEFSLGRVYEQEFAAWLRIEQPVAYPRGFAMCIIGYGPYRIGDEQRDVSLTARQNPLSVEPQSEAHLYLIDLPALSCVVKVGKARWPGRFSQYALPNDDIDRPIELPVIPYETSPAHASMMRAVRRSAGNA